MTNQTYKFSLLSNYVYWLQWYLPWCHLEIKLMVNPAFRAILCQAAALMQMSEPHKALGFRVEPVWFHYVILHM
jgi:hypothetical protein